MISFAGIKVNRRIVYNSTSYNNESYNVAFYTNNAANTNFIAEGIISFKDSTIRSGLPTGEQHKPVGSQDTSKYLGDTNYYWNGSKSLNASGAEITADMFVTLEFTGITRNADGTINMHGFLELKDDVSVNAGASPGGTPSEDVLITPDPDILPGDVDGNGVVNILDAKLVVSYYNELTDLTDAQLLAADVNHDGIVNLPDANLIAAYYTGNISSFPTESN